MHKNPEKSKIVLISQRNSIENLKIEHKQNEKKKKKMVDFHFILLVSV